MKTYLDRLYMQISKAYLIVADMSGKDPNVFHEVGYAHALGKKVILLTDKAEDIPFDLKHYSHIVYEGRIADLKSNLFKKIRWYIENPDRIHVITSEMFQIFVNGTELNTEAVQLSDQIYTLGSSIKGLKPRTGKILVHNRLDLLLSISFHIKNRSKFVVSDENTKIFSCTFRRGN